MSFQDREVIKKRAFSNIVAIAHFRLRKCYGMQLESGNLKYVRKQPVSTETTRSEAWLSLHSYDTTEKDFIKLVEREKLISPYQGCNNCKLGVTTRLRLIGRGSRYTLCCYEPSYLKIPRYVRNYDTLCLPSWCLQQLVWNKSKLLLKSLTVQSLLAYSNWYT